MKDSEFQGLLSGLNETRSFLSGKNAEGLRIRIPESIDVVAIRRKTGLSQQAFAKTVSVSIGTLRNWEQGRRVPDGPARVLLSMLAKNPAIVRETLGELERA